jgi:hypothetical protein
MEGAMSQTLFTHHDIFPPRLLTLSSASACTYHCMQVMFVCSCNRGCRLHVGQSYQFIHVQTSQRLNHAAAVLLAPRTRALCTCRCAAHPCFGRWSSCCVTAGCAAAMQGEGAAEEGGGGDQYEEDFIDDSEMIDYYEGRHSKRTKHTGFFVNKVGATSGCSDSAHSALLESRGPAGGVWCSAACLLVHLRLQLVAALRDVCSGVLVTKEALCSAQQQHPSACLLRHARQAGPCKAWQHCPQGPPERQYVAAVHFGGSA